MQKWYNSGKRSHEYSKKEKYNFLLPLPAFTIRNAGVSLVQTWAPELGQDFGPEQNPETKGEKELTFT